MQLIEGSGLWDGSDMAICGSGTDRFPVSGGVLQCVEAGDGGPNRSGDHSGAGSGCVDRSGRRTDPTPSNQQSRRSSWGSSRSGCSGGELAGGWCSSASPGASSGPRGGERAGITGAELAGQQWWPECEASGGGGQWVGRVAGGPGEAILASYEQCAECTDGTGWARRGGEAAGSADEQSVGRRVWGATADASDEQLVAVPSVCGAASGATDGVRTTGLGKASSSWRSTSETVAGELVHHELGVAAEGVEPSECKPRVRFDERVEWAKCDDDS